MKTSVAVWTLVLAGAIAAGVSAQEPISRDKAMEIYTGTCQACHAKYREKTETGFVIKKG